MIRRPPRSTRVRSSAASDVYKRQITYRTRYYGPDRQLRSRSFSTRRDAVAFQAQMKAEQSRGEWIDPRRGKISLDAVWELFAAGQGHLELTTRANYRSAWGMRVQPQFGTWSINRIGHSDIAAWVHTMHAGTRRQARQHPVCPQGAV